MNVARYGWLPVLAAVLGCATFAATRSAHRDRPIVADPSTFAPPTVVVPTPVEVEVHSEHAGVASSPIVLDPLLRPRAKRPAPERLDTVEPWTGEDLAPQLELAAIARTRLEIDRTDAWDPSVRYESAPGQENPGLDGSDPWSATALLDKARAPAGEKLARRRLANEDPWGASGAL